MKIDGMNGKDQWKSSRKADPSDFHVFVHIQFTLAGLEVNRPIEMQDSEIIHVRRAQAATRATFCYVNACLRPRLISVAICAIAWRAGRSGAHAEEIGKVLDSLFNQPSLMISSEKAGAGLFWVPVLITDPGHAPVDVGRLGLPKQSQQPCPFTTARKRILKRYRTGVAHSV